MDKDLFQVLPSLQIRHRACFWQYLGYKAKKMYRDRYRWGLGQRQHSCAQHPYADFDGRHNVS
jgi:hypothetical protein